MAGRAFRFFARDVPRWVAPGDGLLARHWATLAAPMTRCAVHVAFGLLAACGGSDAQCVIDTDCPLFQRCERNRCIALGPTDAGRREGGLDASVEGGRTDGPVDDGRTESSIDGPPADGPTDGARCPTVAGEYIVSASSMACPGSLLSGSPSVTVSAGEDACLLGLSGAIAGSARIDAEGNLSDLMLATDEGPLRCAGSYAGGAFSLSCVGGCDVTLMRR
ncbi:MAG: hypothetical protein NZ898_14405 [Myxococcota bacterium]|nr:hypothetical protein [Myxococcota bacterium]MDW8360843.1 hypothetical protein [Myxococcales bacterium]